MRNLFDNANTSLESIIYNRICVCEVWRQFVALSTITNDLQARHYFLIGVLMPVFILFFNV